MLDRSNLIYRYDGSFEGFLCCVFESYEKKEVPAGLVPLGSPQTTLYPERVIPTDPVKASRVMASIPRSMGADTLDFVQRSFLTCLPQKELCILEFLRLGYRVGPKIMNMLADDTVNRLFKAVKTLGNEAHLLLGFVRFSDFQGALVAEIEPKNIVLPLMARHFCERLPEERFLIHDKTNGMALIYEPHRYVIRPIEALQLPKPDGRELEARALWRLFYDRIEVEGRHNPKCRMTHMPRRYWKYLTEFGSQGVAPQQILAKNKAVTV
jgi:probable DNA metabolism protein